MRFINMIIRDLRLEDTTKEELITGIALAPVAMWLFLYVFPRVCAYLAHV